MKKGVIVTAFIFAIFLSVTGVQALILPQLSMEEMVTIADTIVMGKSEGFHFHSTPEGDVLYAVIHFKVSEYLKNDLGEDEIIIMQIAQERGPDGSFMAGPLAFKVDEEVLLFLTEEDSGGFRHVLGLSQGKYAVTQDREGRKFLVQEMKDIRLYDKVTKKISREKDIRVKLRYEEFKALVYEVISKIEARKEVVVAVRPTHSN